MAFPSTFLDLQTAVITKARLDTSLDTAKVKDWINQVYAQVCIETEANVTTTTANLVAGTASYTTLIPSSTIRIKQMAVKPAGSTQFNPPMIRTSLDEILNRRQFGGDVANSGGVIPQSTHYALVGLNQLELWPTPPAADVITIWQVALPTALSGNTDVPILMEPYSSKLLEYGALVQAGDFKGDPATADWEAQFDAWMNRYREHLAERPGDLPGQFHQWGSGWDASSGGVITHGY